MQLVSGVICAYWTVPLDIWPWFMKNWCSYNNKSPKNHLKKMILFCSNSGLLKLGLTTTRSREQTGYCRTKTKSLNYKKSKIRLFFDHQLYPRLLMAKDFKNQSFFSGEETVWEIGELTLWSAHHIMVTIDWIQQQSFISIQLEKTEIYKRNKLLLKICQKHLYKKPFSNLCMAED